MEGHDHHDHAHHAMNHAMDHSMDHAMEHNPSASEECPMSMVFHWTTCEKILFNGWNTNTLWSFVISCIGIFIAAFLYEGLRFIREQYVLQIIRREVAKCAPGCEPPVRTFRESVLSKGHIIQSIMYLLQLTVSYLLMLIAMTFNLYLFIAIIGGAAIGYFTFGWVRQRTIDDSDCCNM